MERLEPHHAPPEIRGCRILLLDDQPDNLRVLERILGRAGYRDVEASTEPTRIRALHRRLRPDLLLLDLHMPGMDGYAVLAALREEVGPREYLPVLVVTGVDEPEARRRALEGGARDFVSRPFEVAEILLRIRNLLETRRLHQQLHSHAQRLEGEVRTRTRELRRSREEILHRLALAAEYRDDATGRHAQRVGILSALLARALGAPPEVVELIRLAAPLHDVGKIGVPDRILLKPGPLTDEEMALMRTHTAIGARILGGSDNLLLRLARRIALSHHERWDGSGYDGMAGEAIPLEGRIVAVADVWDSLTHARPYREASPPDEVLAMMVRERGRQFDPRVVDALLEVVQSGELERVPGRAVEELSPRPPADDRRPEARRNARRAGGTRS